MSSLFRVSCVKSSKTKAKPLKSHLRKLLWSLEHPWCKNSKRTYYDDHCHRVREWVHGSLINWRKQCFHLSGLYKLTGGNQGLQLKSVAEGLPQSTTAVYQKRLNPSMQTCRRLQPLLRASEQRFKPIRTVKPVASEKPRTLGPPQINAQSGNSTQLLNRALESFGSEFSLRGEYRVHSEDC